jgi:hypothetical protein
VQRCCSTPNHLLENPDNLIAISPQFNKLVTALRTAVANEYKLDKEQTWKDITVQG